MNNIGLVKIWSLRKHFFKLFRMKYGREYLGEFFAFFDDQVDEVTDQAELILVQKAVFVGIGEPPDPTEE